MKNKKLLSNKFLNNCAMVALLSVVAACTGSKTESTSTDTIKVGEVGSMTGSEATFGTSTHKGLELATEEINAAGGVNGKKIEVISLDDQGKPEEAATAMTKLITQDKVVAVLGEVASSRSLAMAPIAQQNKIPMITPASTNPKVTEMGDYVFRVCFIDPFQGTVMAKFAKDTLKAKKVAILRDVKSDYSMGLSNFFEQAFKAGGGEVAVIQSYSSGDIDFKSQLTAIKAKKPDAIFVPGYYTEVGLIVRQVKELKLNVPLMGGDGWDSPKLYEIGGDALNGHYFSNHYSAEDKNPGVQNFVTKFKAKFNETPDTMAVLGYDALYVLADSMKRAKSLNGSDLRDAIAATKNYQAVTGNITLDEKRNPTKSAVVLKIDGGNFKYVSTVNP
jgi:branched-chain amino acid transport system substrate-binding protein